MENRERWLPEFGLAVLVSGLATIISSPILSFLITVPRWESDLPSWLHYLLISLVVFVIVLLAVLLIVWRIPLVRVRAALLSQRSSTPNVLGGIEFIALLFFIGWLILTTNIFASPPISSGGPFEIMTTEFNRILTLPPPDNAVLIFFLISGVVTFILARRNSAIVMSADECYLMLRQMEYQRNDRFEFDQDAPWGQLRRQGRILDLLTDLDKGSTLPKTRARRQDTVVSQSSPNGALQAQRMYEVTRLGGIYHLGPSPFLRQAKDLPPYTSTEVQNQLCVAANKAWRAGEGKKRWRRVGGEAEPIRYGRLFGNRLDDLFNRGDGFAFYPTRGTDFVTMVIKGPPGAGKSTLALQMCVTQAQQGNVCLYFSLEDERGSLVQSARNFGWDTAPASENAAGGAAGGAAEGVAGEENTAQAIYDGVLNLPLGQSRKRLRQSAQVVDEKAATTDHAQDKTKNSERSGAVLVSSFGRRAMRMERRLKQVRKVWGSGLGGLRPWTHVARCVVIDSLEGFANAGADNRDKLGVTRSQLLKLKNYFRHRCDLLIILVEDDGSQIAGFSEFLADAVITLGRREEDDYTVLFAEIVKARNQTHALGKTQIKIRSQSDLDSAKEAVKASIEKLKPGVLVFPSLHYRLFQTQQESLFDAYTLSTGFTGFDEMLTPAVGQTGSASTKRGGLRRKTATTLLGPRDTGKSILAMNFLIEGIRENSRTLLLSLREDPSAVTDVTVPQEEGRIRFSWQKAPAPAEQVVGQTSDPARRDGDKEMLYHQLEWDLDGVLQWREEHLSSKTETLAYTQQLTYKRWRLPFLFCQMPVSYAELETDPQTIAQAESVIQFLANFGEELAAIHKVSPDVEAEEARVGENRAMTKVIRWTAEERRRAAEAFEYEWKTFEKDLLARTRAYAFLTEMYMRQLPEPDGQNEAQGKLTPSEKKQALAERARKDIAAKLLNQPLATALTAEDAEAHAFAEQVQIALGDARQTLEDPAEFAKQRDSALWRDHDNHQEAKRIHLDQFPGQKTPDGGAVSPVDPVAQASPVEKMRSPCLRWDSRRYDLAQQQVVSGTTGDDSLLVVKGFRPGNITADDFVDQVLRIIGDPHDQQSKTSSRFERVVFDDVTQLRQRFPILDKTRLFIPTLIDMFKAHGITSLFIADVDDFKVSEYNSAVRDQDHGLGVIADQVIRTRIEAQEAQSSSTDADARGTPHDESAARLIVEARAKPAKKQHQPHEIHFGDRAGVVNVELVIPTDRRDNPQSGASEDVSHSEDISRST